MVYAAGPAQKRQDLGDILSSILGDPPTTTRRRPPPIVRPTGTGIVTGNLPVVTPPTNGTSTINLSSSAEPTPVAPPAPVAPVAPPEVQTEFKTVIETAKPASTGAAVGAAAPSKPFLENTAVAVPVLSAAGLAVLAILILIGTCYLRRAKRKKLMREAISFDPDAMGPYSEISGGRSSVEKQRISDYEASYPRPSMEGYGNYNNNQSYPSYPQPVAQPMAYPQQQYGFRTDSPAPTYHTNMMPVQQGYPEPPRAPSTRPWPPKPAGTPAPINPPSAATLPDSFGSPDPSASGAYDGMAATPPRVLKVSNQL